METIELVAAHLGKDLGQMVVGMITRGGTDEENCEYGGLWEECMHGVHYNYGLLGACKGGHLHLTELMIEKGAI